MLNSYKLVKTEDLEATEQLCVDLNKAVERGLDLLGKAMRQIEDQRSFIHKQELTIEQLRLEKAKLESELRAATWQADHPGFDIDFPNNTRKEDPEV